MVANYDDLTSSHQTRTNARRTPLCAVRAHTVRTLQGGTFVRVRESLKVGGEKQRNFLDQKHFSSLIFSFPACNLACKSTCSGPGAENCTECKSGYLRENGTCIGR